MTLGVPRFTLKEVIRTHPYYRLVLSKLIPANVAISDMSRQGSKPVEEQTIHVQAGPEPKPTHRKTNGLACPQCHARFNRTAHLRRHQMTRTLPPTLPLTLSKQEN